MERKSSGSDSHSLDKNFLRFVCEVHRAEEEEGRKICIFIGLSATTFAPRNVNPTERRKKLFFRPKNAFLTHSLAYQKKKEVFHIEISRSPKKNIFSLAVNHSSRSHEERFPLIFTILKAAKKVVICKFGVKFPRSILVSSLSLSLSFTVCELYLMNRCLSCLPNSFSTWIPTPMKATKMRLTNRVDVSVSSHPHPRRRRHDAIKR